MGWRSCSHRAGSIEASFQTSLQLNGLSASEQRHAYLVGPPPLNGPMWNGFKPSQPPPPQKEPTIRHWRPGTPGLLR